MYTKLEAYRKAKIDAANAKDDANAVIATEGTHTLPEHCDKAAIEKVFAQLARANKNAKAILGDLDGAKIYADAEKTRQDKRDEKARKAAEALENAINARLDAIMADDTRRALFIAEANAAAEMAAQASQPGDVAAVA